MPSATTDAVHPQTHHQTERGVLLTSIEVADFKSFRSITSPEDPSEADRSDARPLIVGPFAPFSAVVGPNGVGKSNLIDAVCFALGERPPNLRVKRLNDLISSSNPASKSKNSPKCSVSLNLNCSGLNKKFKREISPSSTSVYSIDGLTVSSEDYLKTLSDLGLNIKTRNFAVFQGTVASVGVKNPTEMCTMFEQLSGSEKFIQEYENLRKQVEKLDENFKSCLSNRKRIITDQKSINCAKDDLKRFDKLKSEISKMKTGIVLLNLYKTDLECKNSVNEIDSIKSKFAAKQNALAEKRAKVASLDSAIPDNSAQIQQIQKKLQKIENSLKKDKPELVDIRMKIEHNKAEIKSFEKLALKVKNEAEKVSKEIQKLEEAYKAIELEESQSVNELSQSLTQKFPKLSQKDLETYNKLKVKAEQELSAEYNQAAEFERKLSSNHSKINTGNASKTQLEVAIKQKQIDIANLEKQHQKQVEVKNHSEISKNDLCQESEKVNSEISTAKNELEGIQLELKTINEELSNAQGYQSENSRKRKKAETLQQLKRLFPGIHGRLYELCDPRHKKYNLAVARIFGQHMDSIVIDTLESAKGCLKYLKNERIGQETFLPLDNLKKFEISAVVSRFAESYKVPRLIDVLAFESQYTNLFTFICKDTIVCEDSEFARKLAYESSESNKENEPQKIFKTVSLDGIVFRKSGLITGGASELKIKAKAWDDLHIEKLVQKQASLNVQMRQKLISLQKEHVLTELSSKIKNLDLRLNSSTESISSLLRMIKSEKKSLAELEESLKTVLGQINAFENENSAIYEKNSSLQSKIMERRDEIFKDFCKTAGIKCISAFDDSEKIALQQKNELQKEYQTRKNTLEVQLSLLRSKEFDPKLKRFASSIEQLAKSEQSWQNDFEKIKKQIDLLENEKKALLDEKSTLSSADTEIASQISEINSEIKKLSAEERDMKRKLIFNEGNLQNQIFSRNDILKNAKIDGIKINFNIDDESENSQSNPISDENLNEKKIDYSLINEHIKNIKKPQSIEKYVKNFQDNILKLEEDLVKIPPLNKTFIDKHKKVNEEFKKISDDFASASKELSESKSKFDDVKKERSQAFMHFFNNVSSKVQDIYQNLTGNPGVGAFLTTENMQEPYLGGVTFSCIPPGKNYTCLDQLSGGEKTMAALALIFALSASQGTKNDHLLTNLFVLDEVDAALDQHNIEKLAKFILQHKSNGNTQFLLISHKLDLYQHADTLFGLYKDPLQLTNVLSLDLRNYQ